MNIVLGISKRENEPNILKSPLHTLLRGFSVHSVAPVLKVAGRKRPFSFDTVFNNAILITSVARLTSCIKDPETRSTNPEPQRIALLKSGLVLRVAPARSETLHRERFQTISKQFKVFQSQKNVKTFPDSYLPRQATRSCEEQRRPEI